MAGKLTCASVVAVNLIARSYFLTNHTRLSGMSQWRRQTQKRPWSHGEFYNDNTVQSQLCEGVRMTAEIRHGVMIDKDP